MQNYIFDYIANSANLPPASAFLHFGNPKKNVARFRTTPILLFELYNSSIAYCKLQLRQVCLNYILPATLHIGPLPTIRALDRLGSRSACMQRCFRECEAEETP